MDKASTIIDKITTRIASADEVGSSFITLWKKDGEEIVELLNRFIDSTHPRLLTRNELFKQDDHTVLWAEDPSFSKIPFLVEYDKAYNEYSTNGLEWVADSDYRNIIGYGTEWRLWTAMPTEVQRQSTKWEGEES